MISGTDLIRNDTMTVRNGYKQSALALNLGLKRLRWPAAGNGPAEFCR